MSTDATNKRGPYAGTRKRREQITRAVAQLVVEVGHDNVTIAQVAELAGASEATVMYHFPSKDHLLVAALEQADHDVMEQNHVIDGDTAISLDEFRTRIDGQTREDPMLRLLLAVRGMAITEGHPAQVYMWQRTELQIKIFTRLMAHRQSEGLAHPGLDPERTAIEFIAMWDGLTTLWFTGVQLDLGEILIDSFRRLSGENVMEARAMIRDSQFGL